MILNKPSLDGFYFPSENSPHEATILMLPYRKDTWRNGGLNARKIFLEMARIIIKYEHLYIAIDPSIYDSSKEFFELENTTIIKMNYNDSWARDIMPTFITNKKENRIVDFRFNSWGGSYNGLYDDYSFDDEVKRKMADILNVRYYHLDDFVLEGGSIHVDEYGTLLTTEACLLSPGRNPKYTKEEIENILKDYLGVKKVIFLPHGIVNDETSEHVDNMACFVKDNIILVAYSDEDKQKKNSKEAIEVLSNSTNAIGQSFEIVKMPTPLIYAKSDDVKDVLITNHAKKRKENERLAASYINYYVGNGFILFPQFGVKEDKEALEIIKRLYKDYDVYPIYSKEILLAGGNIHCVTQQIPKRRDSL